MPEQTAERECPFCKEMIKASATKCRYCESSITPERPDHGGVCPFCKESIKPDAVKCKYCKSDLTTDAPLSSISMLSLARMIGGTRDPKPCDPGQSPERCTDCTLDCFLKDPDLGAEYRRCLRDTCNFPSGLIRGGDSLVLPLLLAILRR